MSYDYLIVGGGMVADAAARGIRERDAEGSIGILSADLDEPYTRPALSKKLWTDPDFTWDQVPLGTADDTGAEVRTGVRVAEIDRRAHEVTTATGERVGYAKLLLATGATPRALDERSPERVLTFRSAADYRRLRDLAPAGSRAGVVGGGYIGTEIAAALAQNGVDVDLLFPEQTLGENTFPPALAERFQALFADGGVRLRPGSRVTTTSGVADHVRVELDDGSGEEYDVVVVGLGAAPADGLARDAGLAVDDGVVVDAHLMTSDSAVWAAGDIASYPDPILGQVRVEHVDNAREMGAAAGRSMAGDGEPYTHTPYFYSQVWGVRWEAVGVLDPGLDTLQVDLDDDRSVVYYRDDDGAPRGVLLWNVADRTDAARAVIDEAVTDAAELRDRIR